MAKSFAAALFFDTVLSSKGIKAYECIDKYESESVCALLRTYSKKHGYKDLFKVHKRGNRVIIAFMPNACGRISVQGDSPQHALTLR